MRPCLVALLAASLTGCADRPATQAPPRGPAPPWRPEPGPYVLSAAMAPDGAKVLTGWEWVWPDGPVYTKASAVTLWHVASCQRLWNFDGHRGPVRLVAFLPGGRRGLSAGHDGTVRMWDLERGEQVRCTKVWSEILLFAALTPDGKYLLSWGGDGPGSPAFLKLWDVEKDKLANTFKGEIPGKVNSVVIAPDGLLALIDCIPYAGEHDNHLVIDLVAGKVVYAIDKARSFGNSFFMPDSRHLLSSTGEGKEKSRLVIWEARTGKVVRRFEEWRGRLTSWPTETKNVAFTHEGRQVFSSDSDGWLRSWNLATGKQVGEPLEVAGLCFFDAHAHQAAALSPAQLTVWDLEARKQLTTLAVFGRRPN